jgi:hypothetical protein
MKCLDIEVAIIDNFNPRQNLIVPNVSWGLHNKEYRALHECDLLILSGDNYATEVEIKVSKADLLKDGEKKHKHHHNLIRRLYFAVPSELKEIAYQSIPDHAGLLVVSNEVKIRYDWHGIPHETPYIKVTEARPCKVNTIAVKWTEAQRYQLARLGTMRILGLKRKIQKLINNPQTSER